MKKLFLILAIIFGINCQAQLPDGSTAPNWTLTDIDGTTHSLYNYLDSGYVVFIDFSAVWCPPCWSYHNSGALENLYIDHGPIGYPNVDSNTTDDVMVFFIEGDGNTIANLSGSGGGTLGDWITGTPYPIICTDGTVNTTAVKSAYDVGYWPTIYRICPDRVLIEAGQSSYPYNLVGACPPPASNTNDAKAFTYSGQTETCDGGLTPEITFQNYGLTNLTSLEIKVYKNGVLESTTPWTGNLATYQIDNFILPTISNVASDFIEIKTTLPNGQLDDDVSNNDTYFYSTLAQQNIDVNITVEITTDQYGSETTWSICDDNLCYIAGGPYNDLGSSGTTIQAPVSYTFPANACLVFKIEDSYGDGICCNFGNGSFTVTDANGTILALGGGFADEKSFMFRTGSGTTLITELQTENEFIDNKTYDLLGRELFVIPRGTIYIKNRKKFIR